MRAPAAILAVPLLVGCAAGVAFAEHAPPSLPLAAAAGAVLATLAALAWMLDDEGEGVCVAVVAGAALAGVSMGVLSARDAHRPPLLAWFEEGARREGGQPVLLEAVLREDAAVTDYGASITADVAGIAPAGSRDVVRCCRGGIRLSIGGEAVPASVGDWRAGRTIRVTAMIRLPTVYRNPGLPDARWGMALRGVVLVGSVKSAALVEVVAPGGRIAEAAGDARAWTRRVLQAHVGRRSERSGAIASAILINDRSGLDAEDERRLQEAGTYHVIAISGGNIAILTVMLLAACRAVRLSPASGAAVSIVALVFYAHLTGAPASVARAVTAAVVYLAGRMLDQRGPPLNALAVAVVCAIAAWPLTALDAGFVLSFGATLGILLGTPALVRMMTGPPVAAVLKQPGWLPGPLQWASRQGLLTPGVQSRAAAAGLKLAGAGARGLAWLLGATICAELALAPIGAALFRRVTVAGLVVNFAAVPLMTLTQLGALTTLGASWVSEPVAGVAGAATDAAAWGLVESARLVDVAPWLSTEVPRPAWSLLAVYYAACLWLVAGPRRRLAAVCVGCGYVLLVTAPTSLTRDGVPPRPGVLRAVFLDVGQGDATLLTLPDGRSLLVDAGGLPGAAFDVGGRIVAPSLRAFGVSRLEDLVLTHGDADHVGGALSVARRFRPRTVWEGTPVPPNQDLRALAGFVAASGARWRTVQAGDAERVAGVDVRVWHPPLPDWERQRVRNDDSVVLEFRYGEVSIVLPGDIGREPEIALASRLALAPLVVLKAPHHGSASSSTVPFVRAVRPAAVIFSAGRHNRFGHPAPAVVDRYRAVEAEIFRTDEDGAVVVETDGRTVEISTYGGRRSSIRRE